MTLDSMNRYFEDRGFTVDRIRDSKKDVYIFNISKNGRDLTREFTYPKTSDWKYRDQKQRTFVQNLMRDFYAVTKKEEENNVPDITWKVECFDIPTINSKVTPVLEVSLSGYINNINIKGRNAYVIVKDIEDKLNRHACHTLIPAIDRVIHNNPATIVFWGDGDKTVVKCQEGDTYDPEKGLAMAISKKVLGNKGNYCNVFKKWVPEKPCFDKNMVFKSIHKKE